VILISMVLLALTSPVSVGETLYNGIVLPLPQPVISQPAGMYNAPITVEISTTEPDAVIRFTLEGLSINDYIL